MTRRPRHLIFLREAVCAVVRVLGGAYPDGQIPAGQTQRLFFANHSSHLDTLTLLTALSLRARLRVRPVAARDYWCATRPRRWMAEHVLNVVFIDRVRQEGQDPLAPVHESLAQGWSLIFFPEGTRHPADLPLPFKSGLYRLAQAFPDVRLTPVYLENLHRILPKGTLLPVPLINKVHFGPVLDRIPDEGKEAFLSRAHASICRLATPHAIEAAPTRSPH
ncbi:1-acyl-sn-glycerol-3-phosphate acyltransferase [Aquabacterium soli]|uniref:1-acyl-sn-glycerol-3-phosphate acyltransferase n=1 Tax=Aquabacterium soli TaxID=2493092 RepID=A0A426VA14_9BURK|nr:lysophospholipid acyltransferase family protein [Aquabacterium soli]RRS03733.1 1-acyl-sn-glycerol-3-phosphate acyltransferase [Aquabacterium soli]